MKMRKRRRKKRVLLLLLLLLLPWRRRRRRKRSHRSSWTRGCLPTPRHHHSPANPHGSHLCPLPGRWEEDEREADDEEEVEDEDEDDEEAAADALRESCIASRTFRSSLHHRTEAERSLEVWTTHKRNCCRRGFICGT